jgi:peptidoglycan-associated lipoprotein
MKDMVVHSYRHFTVLLLVMLSLADTGCAAYVKKADFESMIGELRDDNDRQQQEIDALTLQVQQVFFIDDAAPSHFYDRAHANTSCQFASRITPLRKKDGLPLGKFSGIVFGGFSSSPGSDHGFWQ